jgi:hypothetical protein
MKRIDKLKEDYDHSSTAKKSGGTPFDKQSREDLAKKSAERHEHFGQENNQDVTVAVAALSRTNAELVAEEYVAASDLEEFDPAVVNLDALMFVVGKRRYGKTVWTRWLLSHMWPYFREAYVFTTTKHNLFWNQHVPETCIYNGLQWDVVESILERQKEITRVMTAEGPDTKIVPHVCLIFEDVGSLKHDMRYSEDIAKLAFMGRHYNIFMVFMVQDMKSINADVRANADFIALTYQTQARTMEAAQEDWGDWWSNKWVFRELIRKYTQEHGMLVISQPKAVYRPEDALFWSRAIPPEEQPPYRLGHWQQWADAGCVWEEQLEEAWRLITIQQQKKLHQLKRAIVHLEEGEEMRRKQENLSDVSASYTVNQIAVAPDAVLAAHKKQLQAKYAGVSNKEFAQDFYKDAVVFRRESNARPNF